MKAALIGKTNRRPSVVIQRCSSHHLGHQTGAAGGRHLFIEQVSIITGSQEQVTIEPTEVAIDLELLCNRFNAVDRGAMTFGSQKCAALAVPFLNFGEPVVDRV